MIETLDGEFLVIVNQDIYRDLLGTPKDRWKMQHRLERMRRNGRLPDPVPELGVIEGMRFIDG